MYHGCANTDDKIEFSNQRRGLFKVISHLAPAVNSDPGFFCKRGNLPLTSLSIKNYVTYL
jgi:hypothetical protein